MSCAVLDTSGPVSADVAVIGGGIIGLSIALEAQRAGTSVSLIDPGPATGATFAAAGMLAPISELHYQEEELLELTLASAASWPVFMQMLADDGYLDLGYRNTPTLALGADAADRVALQDMREAQARQGLEISALSIREARKLEPLLAPNIAAAQLIPGDHQVDPRAVATAIQERIVRAAACGGRPRGHTIVQKRAAEILRKDSEDPYSPICGVLLDDGTTVAAREVVVANGMGAATLGGLPEHLLLPLREVYGDVLRLRVPERLLPLCTATIRGMVRGLPVYVVPRNDGTVVIGASSREDGVAGVNAGSVHQLLRDAQALLPAVAELELIECTARARPGTPDNAPLLGRVAGPGGADMAGLLIATGFFRHGVLLAPIAAQIIAGLLDGAPSSSWQRFRPDRFSPALQAHHQPSMQGKSA